MTRWIIALALVATAGCYQSHTRASDAGPVADAAIDARVDAGRICGCPGTPTARICVLPLMCCGASGTCEDPARFNCTGSAPTCD